MAVNITTYSREDEPGLKKSSRSLNLHKRPRLRETIIQGFLFICGAVSILTTIGIVYELSNESLAFFTQQLWENSNKTLVEDLGVEATTFEVSETGAQLEVGDLIRVHDEVMEVLIMNGILVTVERGLQDTEITRHIGEEVEIFKSNRVTLKEFFTNTKWNPQIGDFGILPLINATFLTSLSAMLVALPLGLSVAIYLSEYASSRARSILKPILEVLAGVPTVVYGYFALTFTTPLLRSILGRDVVEIYNTGSAGIVIGILILPLVSSMSEDALNAVPHSLREAAYGLGATKLETAIKIVVPAAFSGIAAAFIVAISRAIGETMIVVMAAGLAANLTFNPLEAVTTVTVQIVTLLTGDQEFDSAKTLAAFALGLVLFVATLLLNVIALWVVRRYREQYE